MKEEDYKLCLDLDEFWEEGYFYTKYDVGGGGHSIIIYAKDKEAFIAAFKDEIGSRLEKMLRVDDDDGD